jgi:flagellar protein FlbT
MSGLILKLRAHEQILVNGVIMQNGDRNARLIVKTPDAHILRLRDAIHPDEVDTPVKRVCYIAQLAVAGEVEPEQAAEQIGSGVAQLQGALSGFDGAEHLETAIEQLRRRNFYGVLRALRRILPIEAILLGMQSPDPASDSEPVEAPPSITTTTGTRSKNLPTRQGFERVGAIRPN